MSQQAQILDWLRSGRTLTALDGLRLFGCLRLSGRILELRRAGHPIQARMVDTEEGKRIACYRLASEQKEAA